MSRRAERVRSAASVRRGSSVVLAARDLRVCMSVILINFQIRSSLLGR
jgi:hypothetical protein